MAKKDEYDRFQYLLFLIEFWRVHPESIGKIISENDLQVKIDA
jgi:hypothetical protein